MTSTVRPDGTEVPGWLRPGAVVLISRAASPQFANNPPFRLRLVAIDPKPTYQGWLWITGYALDASGNAVAKRELFVMVAGLRPTPGGAVVRRVSTERRRVVTTGV